MNHRMLTMGLAVLAALVLSAPAPALAQTESPRTPWGAPDLQGVWDFRTITPLQRPEELGDQAFLTEEEAANQEQEVVERNARLWNQAAQRTEAGGNVGAYNNFWMDRGTRTVGSRRTSLIVDPPNGRIPPLSAEGQARADTRAEYRAAHPADSWEDRSVGERCVLGFNSGPPMEPRAYNNHMQLFQTADHVVILNEMVHDARIIPLDGGSLHEGRDPVDGRLARAVGGRHPGRRHHELLQQELVHRALRATTAMTLQERFTRIDAETLLYEFTVEDPATWTAPWTVEVPMLYSADQVWEYACHEGNYGMDGILAGHRAEERDAAQDQ